MIEPKILCHHALKRSLAIGVDRSLHGTNHQLSEMNTSTPRKIARAVSCWVGLVMLLGALP